MTNLRKSTKHSMRAKKKENQNKTHSKTVMNWYYYKKAIIQQK